MHPREYLKKANTLTRIKPEAGSRACLQRGEGFLLPEVWGCPLDSTIPPNDWGGVAEVLRQALCSISPSRLRFSSA